MMSPRSPRCDPDVFQSPQDAHLHLVMSLKPGDVVYIAAAPSSHSEEAFHKCKVTKVTETAVHVTLPAGEKRSVPPLDVLPAGSWQPKLNETDDLCALPSLNEATVLAALQHRFNQQAIYTWIANLLVSVNPCQPRCAEPSDSLACHSLPAMPRRPHQPWRPSVCAPAPTAFLFK